ncbi:hypothetical protein NA57DRAFT_64589 [Rhizodiscina lignyota]|uniref:allantoicase n=1 Tax=Rhizodiscina lignyota TaxID=1504668 RepID=A0A9P4IIV8_9PEZI|nr:hypothetical protein NA57DRAFT_64589 [Rhizodiscina lignyota]
MDHHEDEYEPQDEAPRPKELPSDLPRSLDDRRPVSSYQEETEFWDGWQGQSQFISSTIPTSPLKFNLSLDEPGGDVHEMADNENKIVQMLATQARLKQDHPTAADEEAIISDEKTSDYEKRDTLQSMLSMAASNGETERVKQLLTGPAKGFINVNAPDTEGTPPLIYASCFGHQDAVSTLLENGAAVDIQDRNQWTALMWAMTNRHKGITKLLLDNGASPELKSSSGRTAFDFVAPNSDISDYLHESGYNIGNVGITDDWYDAGLSQDRFEEEMAENELKRRMMMESAVNLEVDLGNLGLDEQPESPGELEDGQEFVWDRCLNDQMFVFQETELGRILDIVVTHMTPQRSPSQKPVPANILFLSARYAHYHASHELLENLMISAMDRINDVVERHQWDMTILAFWISNATLLLHYLKKDAGLVTATVEFQAQLAELINEIFILIIRDAERRMDKNLDASMLDHETIPGFEDVHFQNEWKIFRSKPKVKAPEAFEKRYRPPSPKRRAQPSPRNITSLLSSTLFVLDLYDIHSVITAQILSQLLYWLGAELFNRIMSNRKYLARTKAMQIRMNVSTLEDWARSNNRQPEHYENGAMTATGENTVDAARRHLAPVVQLLQWLQCLSSLGEDFESLVGTIQQLPRLSPQQLIHAVNYYRAEVGEKGLDKSAMRYLRTLEKEVADRRKQQAQQRKGAASPMPDSAPSTPAKNGQQPEASSPITPRFTDSPEEEEAPEHLLMDPALMLPFSLPTSTDMLITYGAGLGGMNRERERKYWPTVPADFLAKLDSGGGSFKATSVPAAHIQSTFGSSSIDLVSKSLNSRILGFSDEWFAAAENLTTPTAPVRKPGVFTHAGAWYDGWETRRHNPEEFDWVIIRLGVASGRVKGVEIDTAYFDGNHAPEIAVEGCFAPDEEDGKIIDKAFGGWETILDKRECGPSRRHAWLLNEMTEKAYTHVRLLMYPDGGIARFKLYGEAVPVFPQDIDAVFDLAATVNGGVAIACSDQHFGTKDNLLLPGRGVDMGDGWETKRTRGQHVDWVIVRLGVPGEIEKIVVDTAHFRGNFPQEVQAFAGRWDVGKEPAHDDKGWKEVLQPQKTGPDKEHEYNAEALKAVKGEVYSHVKMVIIPDGGVKRLRVFGKRRIDT